jgi:RnfABCDGE-type electron transport complex D subunit
MSAPVHAPHAHAGTTVRRIMLSVMVALLPATLYGFWLYGWPAILLWCITVGFAALGEADALRLADRPVREPLADGSVVLTGWLLALSLPPWAPWWIGAIGGAFAAIVGKQVFGGIGQNLFNPAMVARVALLISFPVEMTQWVRPVPLFSAAAPGLLQGLVITFLGLPEADAVTSASLLGHAKSELTRGLALGAALQDHADAAAMFGGMRPGSLGETSALLLAAGGIALLWLRVFTWHVPVAMLAALAVPAAAMHAIDAQRYASVEVHLLSGGLMLGAWFIATDPVTSPSGRGGRLVFGAGCGLLTYVIRTWGGYPEGVAFAVLLMNAVTPVIDRYLKPRIYGRTRKGEGYAPPPRNWLRLRRRGGP